MANRLRDATSPYLLQHADNPVDWWPWTDGAFAAAAERNVPVLLSVGYSACHWCHVMAHESFEDEATAALMNENLVCIKVDREERPDVDSVYMAATQAMTGQGGWPMTVFLTPGREPFFCGTYFPRAQFQQLVQRVAQAWRDDRDQITGQAGQIAAALAERAGTGSAAALAPGERSGDLESACTAAVTVLAREFDSDHGGFGGAPKFPPSAVLEFLLRHFERAGGEDGARARAMAEVTAEAMARGGIYDQLGGGFARYSVDADWVVPHFEKMLYDNALLARAYTHLWRRTGSPLARRVAEQTCDFLLAEMRTDEGGFAAALDADSDGAEGAFYVWTPAQLTEVLGAADGGYAAAVFAVTDSGTFTGGSSVLRLPADPADPQRFSRVRSALAAGRSKRQRPARDDKVVAAWNGLAIAALAEAGLLMERPDFSDAAAAAADLLVRVHLSDGRLARTSRAGRASGTAGVLEDYGCVAAGLIALAGASDDGAAAGRRIDTAGLLLDAVLARFGAPGGGFFDTADDGEQLIYRPADVADGPTPSGTFAVADALLSYSALTGSSRHRDAAAAALSAVPALASRYPRAAGWGLAVAEALLAGPAEIAVVGPDTAARAQLHRVALQAAPPGAVLAVGDGTIAPVPLLTGKTPADGAPAAYVCRNFACQAPVTQPDQLRAALG